MNDCHEGEAWSRPAPASSSATRATTRTALRRALGPVLRSHLTHFLVLGGAIFALAPPPAGERDIHLSRSQLAALYGADARRTGHGLDEPRRREIDTRAVEDEILYREALRLGLDRGDGVVRQRLIQKVIFLAEDLGGASSRATEADLRAFYDATRERWRAPERWRFVHVFVGPGKRDELAALRPRVIAEGTGDSAPDLGDAFPLPRAAVAPVTEIASGYGQSFVDALAALPPGQWSEPVVSRYGLHLVKVLNREEPRQETFEEARARLKLAHLVDRKERALRAYLAKAFERYEVDIDGEPVTGRTPGARPSPERNPEAD